MYTKGVTDTSSSSSAGVAGAVKRCCRCGKDLTGHKRYKDRLGYWCRSCHSLDKKMASNRLKFSKEGKNKGLMIALICAGVVLILLLLYMWI